MQASLCISTFSKVIILIKDGQPCLGFPALLFNTGLGQTILSSFYICFCLLPSRSLEKNIASCMVTCNRVYRHLRILKISLARFMSLCPRPTQTWGKTIFKNFDFSGVIPSFLSAIVKYTENGVSSVGNRLLYQQ